MDGFGDADQRHKTLPYAHMGSAGGSSGGTGTPTQSVAGGGGGPNGSMMSSAMPIPANSTYYTNGYHAGSYGVNPHLDYHQQTPSSYHNGDTGHGYTQSALSSGPHSPIGPPGPGSSVAPSMSLLSQALQMANARQNHGMDPNQAGQHHGPDWQQYDASQFGPGHHAMQPTTSHGASYPQPSPYNNTAVGGSHFSSHAWQPQMHSASPYTPSHPGSTDHSRRPSISHQPGAPPLAGMSHQQALHLQQQLRDGGTGPSSAHQSPGGSQPSIEGANDAWQHRPDMLAYRQPAEPLFSPGIGSAGYEDQFSLAAANATQAAAASGTGSAASHGGRSRAGTHTSQGGGYTPASSGSGVAAGEPSSAADFSNALEGPSGSTFPARGRRGSSGADGTAADDEEVDPEVMAKKDPLATQVWRMYAKQKNHLSNGARMENITWRMMAMTLRKKKEEEKAQAEAAAAAAGSSSRAASTGLDSSGASSKPLSRQASGSGHASSSSHQPVSAMKASSSLQGLTSIDGAPKGSKGRARFAEVVQEEERGRRGRSPRTPESHA